MPRPLDDYEDDSRRRGGTEFPGGVKAAGFIWIGFGVIGLINSVLNIALNAGQAAAGGGGAAGPSPYAGVGCGVLFAIAFLIVGIQTVKGTAKSTLGNGIGSIIFGVLYLTCGGFALLGSGMMPAGADATLVMVVSIIMLILGMLLLLAGVLALMGKSAYEAWREAEGLAKPKRRTQEERDYDDDRRRRPRDDDRPRRPRDDDEDDRPRRPRRDDDE
jgi:hypothetical protein